MPQIVSDILQSASGLKPSADEKISVNIDSLLEIVQDKKGVQVDLSFNNDKFIFFLTR